MATTAYTLESIRNFNAWDENEVEAFDVMTDDYIGNIVRYEGEYSGWVAINDRLEIVSGHRETKEEAINELIKSEQ